MQPDFVRFGQFKQAFNESLNIDKQPKSRKVLLSSMHKSQSIDSIHSLQAGATVSDDGEETFNFKSNK